MGVYENINGSQIPIASNLRFRNVPIEGFVTEEELLQGLATKMNTSAYDSDGTVAQAGGIPEYVEGEIESVETNETSELPIYQFDNKYAYYPQNGKITGTSSEIYSTKRYDVRNVDEVYATFSTNERTSSFAFVLFIDDSDNIISEACRVTSATEFVREKIAVPDGATYCSLTYYSVHGDGVIESYALFNPLEGVSPISRKTFDGGYANIFRKIGVIGDSISCGAIDVNGGQSAVDHWEEYAWSKFMSDKTGCQLIKLAQGGLQINNWMATPFPSVATNPDNKADSYFFMIGHNDQGSITGTTADINTADLPSSLDSTTYGKFGRIIGVCKTANPDAKLFFITYPVIISGTLLDRVNTMIREVCETVGGYLIDLATYDKLVKQFKPTSNSAHYTPLGYYYMSVEIMTYVDYIVRHNFSDFADLEIDGVKAISGEGVPSGGTTGQVLVKSSDADYDTEWGDISANPSETRNLAELSAIAKNVSHKFVSAMGDAYFPFDSTKFDGRTGATNASYDNDFLIKKRNSHTLKMYSDSTLRRIEMSIQIDTITKADLPNYGVWFYIPKETYNILHLIEFQVGGWNGFGSVINPEVAVSIPKTSMNIGWNFFKFTGNITAETVAGMRVMITDMSSNEDATHCAKEIYFDSLVKGYTLKPTVLLAFDNCEDATIYDFCYQYAKARGIVGTFAYQGGLTPDGGGIGVTRSHLNEMIEHGWDATQYDGNPMDGGISAIKTFNNELRAENLDMYCYFPRFNDVTDDIWNNLDEMKFKMARFANSNPYINALGLNSYNSFGLTFANDATNIKSKIDSAIADGKMLSILVHKPVDENDGTMSNCLKTDYEEVLSYISTKQKSGEIQTATFKELYYATVLDEIKNLISL